MNVKRFTGRTSKEAMQKVRAAFGDGAVVVSTRPGGEGVEIVAMPSDSVDQIERFEDSVMPDLSPAEIRRMAALSAPASNPANPRPANTAAPAAAAQAEVQNDVSELSMSTLSFQDYVRERMLRKREEALRAAAEAKRAASMPAPIPATPAAIEQRLAQRERIAARGVVCGLVDPTDPSVGAPSAPANVARPAATQPMQAAQAAQAAPSATMPALGDQGSARAEQAAMMSELRSMKGLIEERFGALAFMEKLQRQPKHALLTGRLLDCGFSPMLIRKLVAGMPVDVADEVAWAAGVLEHNLQASDSLPALEDEGGVFALVGATGVGKTTSTAKIAAAFAARHGAGQLGLITLDAYRVGAHEQLRAYGRILGVPVHVAHDRPALEDLLDLLSAKKMILIDTAGLAQRDARTRELLDMLSHPSIRRLLVINAASQGETIEDVMVSYRAAAAHGVVLTKLDEAVKLGPALDALIRHRLRVVGVANGQRVPEDWHRLSSQALVHRAMRASAAPAYKLDAGEVSLVFAAPGLNAARPANAATPEVRP